MKSQELKDVDAEDIEELLLEVEVSFGVRFVANELQHIDTFGQLCDHVVNKITLDQVQDCTSQQAFYKLRDAIFLTQGVDPRYITPSLQLNEIFPRLRRRQEIRALEKRLDFSVSILRPPNWLTTILASLLLVFFFGLFFYWKIAVVGILVSCFGIWLSHKWGNELNVLTLRQLAEKVTREQYLKSRRNANSFNKLEIEKILIDWFSDYFGLDKSKLTRDAKIY